MEPACSFVTAAGKSVQVCDGMISSRSVRYPRGGDEQPEEAGGEVRHRLGAEHGHPEGDRHVT